MGDDGSGDTQGMCRAELLQPWKDVHSENSYSVWGLLNFVRFGGS